MGFVTKVEQEHGFKLLRLEYGTGLAVDYFAADPLTPEVERLNAVSAKLREVAESIELTVEMGRFFAAPCGHYFTKVMDCKTNAGVNYAIVDGGIHQLRYDGQIQGMQIPRIFHVKAGKHAENVDKWTLCGSLCTTGDVLTRDAEFDTLEIGDVLVFQWTGAYSAMEGMAVFLSRDMPQIFIYSKETGLVKARGRINTDCFNMPDEYRRNAL
jgi:diaminopimelate decarboxylase